MGGIPVAVGSTMKKVGAAAPAGVGVAGLLSMLQAVVAIMSAAMNALSLISVSTWLAGQACCFLRSLAAMHFPLHFQTIAMLTLSVRLTKASSGLVPEEALFLKLRDSV